MTIYAPIPTLPSPAARPRIGMGEVCAIAMVSRVTIRRRFNADPPRFPKPVDRGQEAIFDRKAVYDALGISPETGNHATPEPQDPWMVGADALAAR